MMFSFKQHAKASKLLCCLLGLVVALSIAILQATNNLHASPSISYDNSTIPRQYERHPLNSLNSLSSSSESSFSANWAASLVTDQPNTYHGALVTFPIPTLSITEGDVSLWAGVGGGNLCNTPADQVMLVQAGIDTWMQENENGSYQQQIAAWSEVYPQPPQYMTFNQSLEPGDSITVTVSSIGQGDHVRDSFKIVDHRTNESQSERLSGSNYATDGASAECVLERPYDLLTLDFTDLPQFQEAAPFSDCEVSKDGNAFSPIGTFSSSMVTMVSENSTKNNIIPLADPGSLNDQENFSVTWKNAY